MDLEDYNEIFGSLHNDLQHKVKNILTNFHIDEERFSDIYRSLEYNLGKDREN
jgi:hypothetical protein